MIVAVSISSVANRLCILLSLLGDSHSSAGATIKNTLVAVAAGQNLADVSKMGHVDLDINGEGGVRLQSRMTTLAPSSSGRRVSLGGHALNGLLQWEHSARNRQKVGPSEMPLPVPHIKPAAAAGCVCLYGLGPFT